MKMKTTEQTGQGERTGRLKVKRHFTEGGQGQNPMEMVDWELRNVEIRAADGSQIFAAKDLEFPEGWSQNAANIVAQKYFYRPNDRLMQSDKQPDKQSGEQSGEQSDKQKGETSLRQMVSRVVETIKRAGIEGGYFRTAAADIFADELTYLLITQRASFNSPVWFNIGAQSRAQQSSACFILSVEDSLDSILNWIKEEGQIFKGGSGSGVNLSKIRGSNEKLSGGGVASGPVSFMRGADSSAGAIRSGGTTRRAAKMVVLDGDHPDILEFVWCKALEERKSRALSEAGFSMGVDGGDKFSIQFQNANNSVRLPKEFFEAVKSDANWELKNRLGHQPANQPANKSGDGTAQTKKKGETIKARALLTDIARAAWECADPGVQYDTTINDWHTTPNAGRISASNPCSEYFHLDNSACNLASLNLLSFYNPGSKKEGGNQRGNQGEFDTEGFIQAVSIMIIAQEILVGYSDYPTEATRETALAYRQLGLGYTNLGALIMSMGLAYDSPEAREAAAGITALMTGQAYLTSAEMASVLGPFEGYELDRENMLKVLDMHSQALDPYPQTSPIFSAAENAWAKAQELAEVYGVRNSQATVLAPTGTISFMMDCDTTGIEPDFALVKTKQLVGGGTMNIANQSVERGLLALGYEPLEIEEILDYISENGSIEGAPGFQKEDAGVFACAVGENPISPSGHLLMMSAVQPFISGGISKTVNLPADVAPEDIADLIIEGNELGLKALAVYRDSSKVSQPLASAGKSQEAGSGTERRKKENKNIRIRKPLPKSRNSKTFEFEMSGCKGYVTVGEYEDGLPGEIFVRVSKQGSTLSGIMDAFAIAVSHGLQYGVPLSSYIDAFRDMRFEPIGITDDTELRFASSIIDYIFRRLALIYLTPEERAKFNIYTSLEREQLSLPINGNVHTAANLDSAGRLGADTDRVKANFDAPLCHSCGHTMVRSGSCFTCMVCGSTSGCS